MGDTEKKRDTRRKRTPRPFPATSFKEALFLAEAIQQHGAGQQIRRLTLFEALDRSPDSGPTRKLITSSNQYGITTGSYSAEFLYLTELGRTASSPEAVPRAQVEAQATLAIGRIAPFSAIYERYKGSRLPTVEVLRDAAKEAGVDDALVAECIEIFLANAREIELVRTIGGTEHLVTIETVLDEADSSAESPDDTAGLEVVAPVLPSPTRTDSRADLSDVCFVISPIGADDSIERKHANVVLTALIEPALKPLDLRCVRADRISKPGLITGQVIDHIARAALVVADLSFGNPNVYYELALRNATRKPVVQLIRSSDRLPFDVGQFRTVTIDMTDIYTLVPQIDLHRQEITRQCRAALEEGATAESPLSRFYPDFWEYIAQPK